MKKSKVAVKEDVTVQTDYDFVLNRDFACEYYRW